MNYLQRKKQAMISMHQDFIPSGYKQVEYLESTGEQRIITNLVTSQKKLVIEQELYFMRTSSKRQLSGTDGLFSGMDTSGNCDYSDIPILNRWVNLRSEIIRTSSTSFTKSFYLNGELIKSSESTYYPNNKVCIFCISEKGYYNYYCYARCRKYKVWEDDVLKIDCISSLNQNNKPCMYDTVSGKTYYNQGTGEFLYGEVIN